MRSLVDRGDLWCLNTATLGHRDPLEVVVQQAAQAGFGSITPWRREVDERRPERSARLIRDAGLKVGAYCRSTFLTGADANARRAAIDDNRRALEVAAELGAPFLVGVVGGMAAGQRDVDRFRGEALESLAALLPTVRATGVRIALEPLHPYYAADRSVLNTVAQAVDWCDQLDPAAEGWFGIAVDAYHVWWDPSLAASIARAGRRVVALHVCDWRYDTRDPLLDRAMMGDGVIDLPALRGAVEAAGYDGPVEVEIFSKLDWWARPAGEVLSVCTQRLQTCC